MLQRSLPIRILIVNFILLILPIALYFFFIFNLESKREFSRSINEISNIANSRAGLFGQVIRSRFKELSAISNLLDLQNGQKIENNPSLNKLLQAYKIKSGAQEINFFIATPENEYFIFASSDLSKIGKNDSNRLYIPQAIENGRSAYLSYHTFSYGKFLFISQAIYSSIDGSTLGVISMVLPIEGILKEIESNEYLPFDSRISILTSDGIVFTSSDPSFEMNSIYPISAEKLLEIQNSDQFGPYLVKLDLLDFDKIKDYENIFEWQESGTTRVGVIAPVDGSDKSIFVDCQKDSIAANFYKHLRDLGFLIALLTIILSLLNLWFTFRIGKPLDQLFNVMHEIADGSYQSRYKKDSFGFEINEVGTSLNQMVFNLNNQLEDIKNEKAARELMAKELKIGRDIQMSILPQEMPLFKGIDIQARSLPALEVGGDFYDIYVVENPKNKDEKRLVVTIADGAGKGASACLYSLCLRSILRSYAAEYLSIGKVMQLSNNLFWQDTEKTSFFATAFTLGLDLNSKKFCYYSAGHTPCIIRRKDGSIYRLNSQGLPMGIELIETPIEDSFELKSSDLIVLYTDGVTDNQNALHTLFGEKRFEEFLKVYGDLPLPMLLNDLYRELANFAKDVAQYDDITVILLRIL
jgi:sigma-B regulation protein RsbU (phosphoserine phosphatase)